MRPRLLRRSGNQRKEQTTEIAAAIIAGVLLASLSFVIIHGTSNFCRSPVKSVSEEALTLTYALLSPACMLHS